MKKIHLPFKSRKVFTTKEEARLNKQLFRTRVLAILIIINLVIWSISAIMCKNFYRFYTELITQQLIVVRGVEADNSEASIPPALGSKNWILNEWQKIGQREQAYAIIQCESRFDPWAIGDDGNSRGLYQIHKKYNPDISTECAFNTVCSTKWAINEVKKNGWKKWSCAKILGL